MNIWNCLISTWKDLICLIGLKLLIWGVLPKLFSDLGLILSWWFHLSYKVILIMKRQVGHRKWDNAMQCPSFSCHFIWRFPLGHHIHIMIRGSWPGLFNAHKSQILWMSWVWFVWDGWSSLQIGWWCQERLISLTCIDPVLVSGSSLGIQTQL